MNVTHTQIEAHKELKNSRRDVKQKEVIYEAIKELGCAPRRMIAEFLGMPMHVISPRVNELLHEGRIVIDDREEKYHSRTNVEWLKISVQPEIQFKKKSKLKQILDLCREDYVSSEEIKKIIL